MHIVAHLNKVCPATEGIYSDSFYSRLNVVVTALDNVEARRYVDRSVENVETVKESEGRREDQRLLLLSSLSRCVSNRRPLLDSGTMGTKGHTEIIVPNLTESYNSHVSRFPPTCRFHPPSRLLLPFPCVFPEGPSRGGDPLLHPQVFPFGH